ncbi:uncharacterized protein G2W53_009760 [Senna tora]|uniref:Uncharacterized protein n=1 Tax=Senna tora TaxID=362788 RepID=A0A835CAI0_9FABA|nr:uncharacterized protein G2W53_009760 [Senna tora]
MGGAWIMSQQIPDDKSRSDLRNLHELRGKRLVAQVSQTRQFALYSRTGVVSMLRLESSWHGTSVDHVLTYSGRKIAVRSQKPSRITKQKTHGSQSNTSVRVIFGNRSGFDAPIGVVLAWEERGSCLNIFRTTNRGRISETFTNYEAKTCCASESNSSVPVVFANVSGFDAPIGVVLAWEERGSCPNIFRTTNRGRISETFTNYEAKDLLRKRQIAVESQKPSRITRQKTCCASESNTSVRVVFANGSGFDAPIGVVLAWEERGSCLNIFRTTNRALDLVIGPGGKLSTCFMPSRLMPSVLASLRNLHELRGKDLLRKNLHELRGKRHVTQVSQTLRFALYSRTGVVLMLRLESSCHGKSVDHVLTYSGRQIAVGSQKPSRITRQKTCCASESNTSVRVVFANGSDFDAPIGVVLAWEESGSCLNIFRTKNRGQISETFTNYEAKDTRKSVDHVLTYFGREIAVRSQKPSRITRQKTCCASESNTSVRVVFPNGSGFDAPIGVVLAWEERGSCLNIFRTTNRGRMSETFTNYEAKDLLRKNLHELRGKRLVAQVSQTRRSALYSRIGVVLMLRLESSWHGRSVDLVLTYSGRQITVGSQKPSRITRQKTCCASESNTSVRVVFANRSGFDALIGVVLAWEERGSCLNIFRTTNRDWSSETFTNYEAKDLLRKNLHELRGKRFVPQVSQTRRFALYSGTRVLSILQLESSWHGRSVDDVLTYSERQIAVGSQKPSRITRQKTCCASESNTSVREREWF